MENGPFRYAPYGPAPGKEQSDFQELEATELYCPQCRRAVPVRKFLLLVLPDRFAGPRWETRWTRPGNSTVC
ncbi:MAG: hypothetical protein JRJ16_16275 [Deltaproteobacteria bacterium]|nr:hypothetical protein [Deltaproteobacteria bacterium]